MSPRSFGGWTSPDESWLEVRGSASWRPIADQLVVANLDGQVRQVLVTAWNPYTNAVKVAWPPGNLPTVARRSFSQIRQTELAEVRYEPLEPDAFRAATKGLR